MSDTLIQIDQAADDFDTSLCELCSYCGDLRMARSNDEEEQDELENLGLLPAVAAPRLLQQEIRFLRQNYRGLKSAVEKITDDHEKRIRQLEFRVWFALGGGAVLGWLGSALIRMATKG